MCKGPLVRGNIKKQGNGKQAQGDWALRVTDRVIQTEKPLRKLYFNRGQCLKPSDSLGMVKGIIAVLGEREVMHKGIQVG